MKTRYELIIYWSKDDDCFVVEVPELPGCMADGQTYARSGKTIESTSCLGLATGGTTRIRV